MGDDREERIRARAYEIWEREGSPAGHEMDHWVEAEQELDAQNTGAGSALSHDEDKRGIPETKADQAAGAAPDQSTPGEDLAKRQDKLLDQAVEETFPGSDPISPKRITK
ncbi:hypothetical protein MOX02_54700 [Methylobacterium oxalidis]|uniref:DUF2934 domain-containing protein n=2 Tax=Methylobacterium oxalidis TaxID=944322 RepID=A0A512JBU4_9HYPH|nr:DUF2934 domain-containing protein [Methylobacterium oxalidis]GEP07432.1 hypothetical protein MOX02_54700 [Methylobacterium oxalidis]GLS65354.1 hypothetical protein GCM10007888_37360 [Methylobacterium oxalidis]